MSGSILVDLLCNRLRLRIVTLTSLAVLVVSILWANLAPASAETLKLVTNWPRNVYSVVRTLEWVDNFNKEAEKQGVDLRIVYAGGPEVTPAFQQLDALGKGVFDLLMGSTGYYAGLVPEALAMLGTSINPTQARANGGLALLSSYYEEKANAKVLNWMSGGVGFHIWLKEEPKLDSNGIPDLTGLKIRSVAGFYGPWLKTMNAIQVMIPSTDVYMSFERNVIDGAPFPGLGITDYGWDKFIKYRIDPPVWQFDNLVWIGLDAWKRLSPTHQKMLQEWGIEWEKTDVDFYDKMAEELTKDLAARGMKIITLEPKAAKQYIANAGAGQWAQVKKRVPERYEQLREKFPPTKSE